MVLHDAAPFGWLISLHDDLDRARSGSLLLQYVIYDVRDYDSVIPFYDEKTFHYFLSIVNDNTEEDQSSSCL